MKRRLTREQDSRVLAWIAANDDNLYAGGASRDDARFQCQSETGIALSLAAFSRRALLCRTSGLSQFWRGSRPPLKADAPGENLLTAVLALADLVDENPSLSQASPEFLARRLRDLSVDATPELAAQALGCLETSGKGAA